MSQSFNGSNQSASLAIDFSVYSILSVSAWIYVNTQSAAFDQVIWELTTDSAQTAGGFGLIWEGTSTLTVFKCGTGGGFGNASIRQYTPPSTAAWHNVVCTYDFTLGSTNQVNQWIDGILQTANVSFQPGSPTGPFANSTFYVGSRGNSSKWLGGNVQGLAIYNESLSSSDIKSLAAGLSPIKVRPSKLIKAWPFDNGLIEVKSGNTLTNNGSAQSYLSQRIYK